MSFQFVNADLEISSSQPLHAIRDAFAAHGNLIVDLFCGETEPGEFLARFEIHPEPEKRAGKTSAREKIEAFCDVIERLEDSAKISWLDAAKRVIDLGYDSDDHCPPFHDSLPPPTLARMAELKIELALTLYPRTIPG